VVEPKIDEKFNERIVLVDKYGSEISKENITSKVYDRNSKRWLNIGEINFKK
jgi:hypothetical protein